MLRNLTESLNCEKVVGIKVLEENIEELEIRKWWTYERHDRKELLRNDHGNEYKWEEAESLNRERVVGVKVL